MADGRAIRTFPSGKAQLAGSYSEIAQRLRSRRQEIESAITTRVFAVSEPVRHSPDYLSGLRAAVGAAIDHGIVALETSQERPPVVPAALLAQARLAARTAVPLDTVLRRYFAGYTVLVDFIVEEAKDLPALTGDALQTLLRSQGVLHEQVVEYVSEEYSRERKPGGRTGGERRRSMVLRLLAGEPIDAQSLGYQLDGYHHHGLIVQGSGGDLVVRQLAESRGSLRLVVEADAATTWGWLGTKAPLHTKELADEARGLLRSGVAIAIAQPALGAAGWRLTHRQSRAAMAVANKRQDRVVRYVDVALLASLLVDETLAESLKTIYLWPLAQDRDGGESARRTLRAYFAAGRNVSSAAAALGVNRQTVAKRLRVVEDRLGESLVNCGSDLEAALRLTEIESDIIEGKDGKADSD